MGTGYTRNDTANNIADGNVINASDLDGEFDAVQAAFNATTGHSHDGTTGEGPKIDTGGLANDAVTAAILDETASFTMAGLSVTGNTTLGDAASDTVTITADIASDLIPSADGTHDLGATGAEWQDLFIDGTANIDSLVADTADINAGTIDGVTLGTNSAVTEAQIDNININGNAITSTDTNGNITLTPNGTGEVNILDSDKLTLGTGSDLEMSHNGTNSIIENKTGDFLLRTQGAGALKIQDTGGNDIATFTDNGAVALTHNSSTKVETTSAGIDVTGTAQADSFTLDNGSNDWTFTVVSNNLIISYAGTAKMKLDTSGNLTVTGDVVSEGTI